jgi:competence protein ComEC
VAVSVGIVVDRYIEPFETQTWALLGFFCGVLALVFIRREVAAALAIVAAFAAIGGGWHHSWWWDRDPRDLSWTIPEAPQTAWVRGVVREAMGVRLADRHMFGPGYGSEIGDPEKPRTRFVVDIREIQDGVTWRPVSGRAIVIVAGDRGDIRAGEPVRVAGRLSKVAGPLNPGEFDYRGFLRAQRIDLRLTVDEPDGLERDPGGSTALFAGWLGRLRAWSRARLVEGLDSRIEPLAAALVLGQREGVEPDVNDAFSRTGTTHLLAISGLHLQVLAAALLFLCRAMGMPRRPAYVTVALVSILYAVVVGLAPSVVRSTVMTVTFCVAAVARRAARPANTLALAALGTLAANPSYLFDVGCQLSFLAIGALVWLVPPACAILRGILEAIRCRIAGPRSALDELERRLEPRWRTALRRLGTGVVDGVIASTVVWLAALPLVAMTFHIVSPIGVLLNVPLIPLTSGALLLGGLGLSLSALWGPLGTAASWLAGVLLEWTQSIVLWAVAQPWGHWFVAGPGLPWVLVFYGLLGVVTIDAGSARSPLPAPARRRRASVAGWLLAGWSLLGWIAAVLPSRPDTPEAEFLAVGHGLAVAVRTPAGQTVLYDCGRMADPTVGRRIIAPALWSRGISRIDTVILSHADQDHFDGLPDLLDRFKVGVVRVAPGFGGPENPAAVELLAQVRSRGIPVRPIAAPESWESGGVRFTVAHPPAGWHPDSSDNARSVVLDLAYDDRHVLLTGDLEQLGLIELAAKPRPEPPPEVMLAPHHGGRTANPNWLYEWARPRAVVVSQRMPAPGTTDALAPLEQSGIPLLRTWQRGAIHLQWSSDRIITQGFLDQQDRPRSRHLPQGKMN